MHHAAEGIVLHLSNQMHVIGHQAIAIKIKRQLRFLRRENRREPEIVGLGAEDCSAVFAARDHVIKAAANFDYRFPGHPKLTLSLSIFPNQQSQA